jgi:hypothetical protein
MEVHDMLASHCSLSAEMTNLFHVQKTMALLTSKPNQKSNQNIINHQEEG